MFNLLMTVYATGEATAGADPAAMGDPAAAIFTPFFSMIILFGAMYILMIRPQRKKEKALREKIANLRVGDEIITIGGIYGKVISLKDDSMMIESASGVDKARLRIARWAVKECLTIHDTE